MAKQASVASDIFNSPPKGTNLCKINADYDCILENLNALAASAETAFSSIMSGIDEVRQAVNERRSLVIRGEVTDETYGLNVSPEEGNLRWIWFTDGSSGKLPDGDTLRFFWNLSSIEGVLFIITNPALIPHVSSQAKRLPRLTNHHANHGQTNAHGTDPEPGVPCRIPS